MAKIGFECALWLAFQFSDQTWARARWRQCYLNIHNTISHAFQAHIAPCAAGVLRLNPLFMIFVRFQFARRPLASPWWSRVSHQLSISSAYFHLFTYLLAVLCRVSRHCRMHCRIRRRIQYVWSICVHLRIDFRSSNGTELISSRRLPTQCLSAKCICLWKWSAGLQAAHFRFAGIIETHEWTLVWHHPKSRTKVFCLQTIHFVNCIFFLRPLVLGPDEGQTNESRTHK